MRKIKVFQHVGHEPLGTLNPKLKDAGFRIRYINFGRDPLAETSLKNYKGLFVLGGPMGAYESDRYSHLKVEMKLIEEAFKMNIPVLGICLGAQLIAAALGAKVYKAKQWEFGWCDIEMTEAAGSDSLFKDYQKTEKIFQIHQDTFDIPNGAVHLVKSKICEAQAFRFGEKVYGMQFHLEADKATILRWLNRPENLKLISEFGGTINSESLEKDTDRYITRSLHLSDLSFSRFIEIFQLLERPLVLGSTHGKPPKKPFR